MKKILNLYYVLFLGALVSACQLPREDIHYGSEDQNAMVVISEIPYFRQSQFIFRPVDIETGRFTGEEVNVDMSMTYRDNWLTSPEDNAGNMVVFYAFEMLPPGLYALVGFDGVDGGLYVKYFGGRCYNSRSPVYEFKKGQVFLVNRVPETPQTWRRGPSSRPEEFVLSRFEGLLSHYPNIAVGYSLAVPVAYITFGDEGEGEGLQRNYSDCPRTETFRRIEAPR